MLRTAKTADLAIILAGTNDLGHPPRDPAGARDEEIAEDIWGLHQLAHARSVRTVAVSVPGSRYQSLVAPAAALATRVNANLEARCVASGGLCTFVPFPVPYKEGSLWEEYGLHLSPAGYDTVGIALAAAVKSLLE